MKHAIPVKFIAIILCAASLLAAVGSGLSIVMLAENGLYEKTPSQLYAERMEDQAYFFAEQLAQNYASTNLGGCPEEMLGNHHYFNYGYYGYTLLDTNGKVLEEMELEESPESFSHTFTVSGSYMKVVNTYGTSTGSTTVTGANYHIHDAIAAESSLVYRITCSSSETDSASTGSTDPIGYLDHDDQGRAAFVSFDPFILDPEMTVGVNHIAFFGEGDELIYEISNDGSVGSIYWDEAGLVYFTADVASALVMPENTEPSESVQVTEPVNLPAEANVNYFDYFDADLGHEVTVEYEWDVMPEYTVIVTLLPGATYDTDSYTLAGILCSYRSYFPWLLGAGVLIFAITLVYLCCAAGRKPGSDEVRPAALNRLPLDLHLGLDVLAAVGLSIACVEGGTSLFRENAQVGIGFAAACAYGIALIGVGFAFAFSAQFKSKNRYWLRNTICGRLLILIVRFIRWADKKATGAWPAFCGGVKRGWGWFCRAFVATYKFIENAIIKTALFLGRVIKAVWKYGIIFIVRAYKLIRTVLVKFFSWLGRHIGRFFSLLPLTWQWLLMGCLLIFLIFCAVRTSSGGLLIFFVCASFAIILYGAHCFGVLLESARKMRKGDLETKVDDSLLVGSFRDFSAELNGLANVTTVAVQKQLKSERMKAELVTNVSHDIKTPLTSIINYVDLMKRPHTDEEHELYLEVLDRQSQRLKKLIEDLMEMSKASTGNMNVDLISLNAAEAVNQAMGEFADKFASVRLTPVFDHPEEPVMIQADGRLIWRVLSNLFSNAFKYALPGTRLYIDLIRLDDSAVITIKNISKEQLNVDAAELMERFVRGDASRNTEGSGLGLNIARSLVELQQGRMELMVDGDLFKVTLIFPLG